MGPREILQTSISAGRRPPASCAATFWGHWLSAAARRSAQHRRRRAARQGGQDRLELARCQRKNGGKWAGSIAQYLDWIARGKQVWAPHLRYKTLMGLLDMARYLQSEQALEVAANWAGWFHRWAAQFSASRWTTSWM